MTICPCCGFTFKGNLRDGCESCGARSVGEALPKPEHELPSYGRSLVLAVTGSLMVLVFLTQTIIALFRRPPVSLGFWAWIGAAETAAWRLKWVAIPATIILFWGSRKLYRSMLRTPAGFCAMRYARGGLIASTTVPLLIGVLIGVTVPERLRLRQRSIEAGINAGIYRIDRALVEYGARFNTLPSENLEDLKRLPDPDGSLAAALRDVGQGIYKTSGPDVALLPKTKQRALRGAVIRRASVDVATDDGPSVGLSFTNYELLLPGPDKILGTEDDLMVRDGLITRSAGAQRTAATTAATTSRRP